MLITAEYDGPPYNPVTPSPLAGNSIPYAPPQSMMAGLGNRRISPVPGCVNCVAGPSLGMTTPTGYQWGLLALGAAAVAAVVFTLKSKKLR